MSVMLDGVGKSAIARRYFLQGFTSVRMISKPANSTLSWAKRTRVEGYAVPGTDI